MAVFMKRSTNMAPVSLSTSYFYRVAVSRNLDDDMDFVGDVIAGSDLV
jgi:hypothetical protein